MAWPRAPQIIPLCVLFVLLVLFLLIIFKLIKTCTQQPNKRQSYGTQEGLYQEGTILTISKRGRHKPQGLIPYTIDPGSSSSNIVKRSASPLYPGVLTGAAVLGGMATGAAIRTSKVRKGTDDEEDEHAELNQVDERYTDLDTVDDANEDAAGIIQYLGEPSSTSSSHHQGSYSMRNMDITTNSSVSTEAHYNRHEVTYDTHYYSGANSGGGDHYESNV